MKQTKNNKHTIALSEMTTYNLIQYSLYSVNSYIDNSEAVEMCVNDRLNIMFLVIKINSKLEIQPSLFSNNIV